MDDTNLTLIEDFLKKYNSFIVKNFDNNVFSKIPFAMIMYTLIFIFSFGKLMKLVPNELDKKEEETTIKIIKKEENEDENEKEEKKEDE